MFKINRIGDGDVSPKSDRVSWPWREMNIGDDVDIGGDLAIKGQVSAHVYGRARGMKFKTKMVDGVLNVKRVS